MSEEWRQIEEFPAYEVSDQGLIRNSKTNRILRPAPDHGGYLQLSLRYDGMTFQRYVHRLVAAAFCEQPDDSPEVDHLDTDRQNNNASNLEWVSKSENLRRRRYSILTSHKKHGL